MREFREYGSARGALSNERPYRELLFLIRNLKYPDHVALKT